MTGAWIEIAGYDPRDALSVAVLLAEHGARRQEEALDVVQADRSVTGQQQPITSWEAVATALGVSSETVRRRRRERGDRTEPFFTSPTEVHHWFAGLLAPVAVAPARRAAKRGKRSEGDVPVDWSKVKV